MKDTRFVLSMTVKWVERIILQFSAEVYALAVRESHAVEITKLSKARQPKLSVHSMSAMSGA